MLSIFTLSTNCNYFDSFQLQKHSELALFLCISKALSSWLHSSCYFGLFWSRSLKFKVTCNGLKIQTGLSTFLRCSFREKKLVNTQIMICCIRDMLFLITVFS